MVPVPVQPIATTTRPAEPAFVQATSAGLPALPAPEKDFAERPAKTKSPKSRKQGEIDQQLKNIIKDYGEYDLYSPQKSLNLKVAAFAAFALLALLLGGLYFFKPFQSAKPAPVESHSPADSKEALGGVRSAR
jgi:hypothetical protein